MSIDLRHAVVDGSDGTDVRPAPDEREDALRLRATEKFWCAIKAGGCGGSLRLHAGEKVRPYYQHADASSCALQRGQRETSEAYYDLAYQRALAAWLAAQGYHARIEHTFPDGGGRADLHVDVDGVTHSIEVQLSTIGIERWKERTARYAGHVDQITWLHGPLCTTTGSEDRILNGISLARSSRR